MSVNDLIPTSQPLTPQDIHPDELKVILAEAADRHAEAAEALAAAQDLFDAADRQREYALTEEQKRQAREDQFRIDRLRALVPQLDADAERFAAEFRRACAAETTSTDQAVGIHQWFLVWAQYRATAHMARELVIRHDTQQSRDDYISWEHRIAGWAQLIRSVTSVWNGGSLNGRQDDVDGLAAVNLRIVEESKDAPRPLQRAATDTETPFVEQLGIRDPARAGWHQHPLTALEFNIEYSKAVHEAAMSWARGSIGHVSDSAREQFNADAAAALGKGEK